MNTTYGISVPKSKQTYAHMIAELQRSLDHLRVAYTIIELLSHPAPYTLSAIEDCITQLTDMDYLR